MQSVVAVGSESTVNLPGSDAYLLNASEKLYLYRTGFMYLCRVLKPRLDAFRTVHIRKYFPRNSKLALSKVECQVTKQILLVFALTWS